MGRRYRAVFGVAPGDNIEGSGIFDQTPDEVKKIVAANEGAMRRADQLVYDNMVGTYTEMTRDKRKAQPLIQGIKDIVTPLMPQEATFAKVEKDIESMAEVLDPANLAAMKTILSRGLANYFRSTTAYQTENAIGEITNVLQQPLLLRDEKGKKLMTKLQKSVVALLKSTTPQGVDSLRSELSGGPTPSAPVASSSAPTSTPAKKKEKKPEPVASSSSSTDIPVKVDPISAATSSYIPPPPPPYKSTGKKQSRTGDSGLVTSDIVEEALASINELTQPKKTAPSQLVEAKEKLTKTPIKPPKEPYTEPDTSLTGILSQSLSKMNKAQSGEKQQDDEEEVDSDWIDSLDEAVKIRSNALVTQLTRVGDIDRHPVLKMGTDFKNQEVRLHVIDQKGSDVTIQPYLNGSTNGPPITDVPLSLLHKLNTKGSSPPTGRENMPFIHIMDLYYNIGLKPDVQSLDDGWKKGAVLSYKPYQVWLDKAANHFGHGISPSVSRDPYRRRFPIGAIASQEHIYQPQDDIILDQDAALRGRIVARRGGMVLIDQPFDDDFRKLMNNKYSPRYAYSGASIKLFRRVVPLLGINIKKYTPKWHLVNSPGSVATPAARAATLIENDPNTMASRLAVIIGDIQAGNNSRILKSEAADLIDLLLRYKHIDKDTAARLAEHTI